MWIISNRIVDSKFMIKDGNGIFDLVFGQGEQQLFKSAD